MTMISQEERISRKESACFGSMQYEHFEIVLLYHCLASAFVTTAWIWSKWQTWTGASELLSPQARNWNNNNINTWALLHLYGLQHLIFQHLIVSSLQAVTHHFSLHCFHPNKSVPPPFDHRHLALVFVLWSTVQSGMRGLPWPLQLLSVGLETSIISPLIPL